MKKVEVEVSERCAKILELLERETGLSKEEVLKRALLEFVKRLEQT